MRRRASVLTPLPPDNHKPPQTTSKRRTRLTQLQSRENYQLTLEDDKEGDNKDVFIFRGQQTVPKKSYVLLFDPGSQKATLEPLASTYTFNLNSKNGADVSSSHPKIYPRKQKDDVAPDDSAADDLFGEDSAAGDGDGDPDSTNPFDFRHFLSAEKDKRGDESEYAAASSPDYRAGSGSAMNTPLLPASRKPAVAPASKAKAAAQEASKPAKRKVQAPQPKKAPAAKKKETPTVRLERRATSPKPARKPAGPPASKIKSAELVHSSDESDGEAEVEPEQASSPAARRSPSPPRRHTSPESDEDEEMEDVDTSGPRGRNGALASLGLGQNIGAGYGNSPGGGPISLSAASSYQGSPDPHVFASNKGKRQQDDGVIDFGDLGGGGARSDEEDEDGDVEMEEDRDVESYHLGSPVQQAQHADSRGGISLGADAGADGHAEEEEEEDPLLKEMMEGLAGGFESEESEEE